MARTAPVPNIPAIPGMNPGIFVMGGGGGGGGGNGKGGSAAGGGQGADGENGGEDAEGGGDGAGACGQGTGGTCPNAHGNGGTTAGDPVDVVTGRVFTIPVTDVRLPGPLPLNIVRTYSSKASHRDVGMGYGWSHSLAWEIEVRRRTLVVWKDDGTPVYFTRSRNEEGVIAYAGPDGWLLFKMAYGYRLDINGERWMHFEPVDERRCRLKAITDVYANEIALEYEGDRLAAIVDCVGRRVRVTSTRDGRIASFEVKNAPSQGNWVVLARYGYDAAGDLESARDADGHTTRYTYATHLLTSHTSPVGLRFHFHYDRDDRCVETWGEYVDKADPGLAHDLPEVLADGVTLARGIFHCKIEFHPDHYTEVTDSRAVNRYFGNKFGKVDKAVVAGAVHERSYDEHGHVVTYTDPLGATIRWVRDARGRILSVTDALGRTTTTDRDDDGNITTTVDAAGGVTKVTSTPGFFMWQDPLGATFQIEHDGRGLTTATVAPNGARTSYRYDGHGNLAECTFANGAVVKLRHDYLGRCVSLTRPALGESTFIYSDGGRLLSARHAEGATTYTYDGTGFVTSVTDADGRTTHYEHGCLQKLCRMRGPDGRVVSFSYDREGQLRGVVNAFGAKHHIERDAAGHITHESTFDGRTLRYAYDALGQLVAYINGLGERTEIERDLAGQLVARRYTDGSEDAFEYDSLGNMVVARSADAEVRLDYNAVGWLTRETQIVHERSQTVELVYDVMGNPVRRETTQGHSLTWTRDIMGNAAEVLLDDRDRVGITCDALGRELVRQLPGGGAIYTEYDRVGRLARVSCATQGVQSAGEPNEPDWVGPRTMNASADVAFRHTAAGELVSVWEKAHGLTRYEHDASGRLLAMLPEDAPAELFAYSPGGHLSERDTPRAYDAGGRVVTKGNRHYDWDEDGRLVAMTERLGDAAGQTTRLSWNGRGFLQRVEQPDGAVVRFGYDVFGRRVFKHVKLPNERPDYTRFVWDGNALVHELKVAASAQGDDIVEERTYWFDASGVEPIAHADAGAEGRDWFHYLSDDLGRALRTVDGKGNVACDVRHDAWGGATVEGGVTTTPFRLAGQYADDVTGLSYNGHRYFDPQLGSFLSADPDVLAPGFEPHAYANHKPTSMIDPDGRMPFTVIELADGQTFTGASPKSMPQGASQNPNNNAIPNTGKPCGERDALNAMANHISTQNPEMTPAEVQAEIKRQFQNGAKMTTREGTPNSPGRIVPPCSRCEGMLRELGIHPENIQEGLIGPVGGGVIAPNSKGDESGSFWNGDYSYEQDRADNNSGGGGGGKKGGKGGRRR